MATPTSIIVNTDQDEYSRFEEERKDLMVTVTAEGSNLIGEQIMVELRKARRARDEIVASKTVTLTTGSTHAVQTIFHLAEIINEQAIPLVRRGNYFIRAYSISDSTVTADSDDFRVSLVTVARLKADYLHGADQMAYDTLSALEQPRDITGVTIYDVSFGHPKATFPLSYNYVIESAPTVLGSVAEPFALANGNTLVLQANGVEKTVTFDAADFADISQATAAEVAAVIAEVEGLDAADEGGQVRITGDVVAGTYSILVDPSGSATAALGLTGQVSVANVLRSLSWCGGPQQLIEAGRRTYVLRRGDRNGALSQDYIRVRVSSQALLPTQSRTEAITIERKPLDESRIRQIVDQAISWVEDVELAVSLEPTWVTTEVDSGEFVYASGDSMPTLTGSEWDKIVDAVMYKRPTAGHWLGFQMPYYPLLKIERLYGKIANTQIVDISESWIEAHEKTGWVELVPFHNTAFEFIGLMWVDSLRGPVPLPNFWNFQAIVGFRETPGVLIELVAKKAAFDILVIAGQAFRGGYSSQSISRDGVSESVSYTASAMYGIYSATTEAYKKWIDETLIKMRGAFRGPSMLVM